MNETVHILVTVRKPELLPAALLVFRTLRVGFPDNPVQVWGNALAPQFAGIIADASRQVDGSFTNLNHTVHDQWIEGLLASEGKPFWICDTDVVFFSPLVTRHSSPATAAFSGRFEPTFREEWTKTIHVERLHTAVMWFDPQVLRAQMRAWMGQFPEPWGATAQMPLVRQHFIPVRPEVGPVALRPASARSASRATTLFYDSTAGLWHAGLGTPFTREQDEAFEHLHCGTYVDLISPSVAGGGLQALHESVFQNPQLARGLRIEQEKYYQRQAVEI